MSYDYDSEGNKVFYEQGLKDENERVQLDFDNWYNLNSVELQEEYIEKNPEEMTHSQNKSD